MRIVPFLPVLLLLSVPAVADARQRAGHGGHRSAPAAHGSHHPQTGGRVGADGLTADERALVNASSGAPNRGNAAGALAGRSIGAVRPIQLPPVGGRRHVYRHHFQQYQRHHR